MKYTVTPTSRTHIKNFIEQHHYSHNINGLSSTYCFALNDNNTLIGAMIIGKMAMPNQWKKYAFNNHCNEHTVLELRRLVLIDNTQKNAESYFIAKALKWLKKHTDIQAIVSYADPNYGHEGTIYKAANFTPLGQTSPGRIIVYNGKKYHDKTLRSYHKGKLKPLSIQLKHALETGEAHYIKQAPKNIYIYYLHNGKKLNRNTHAQQHQT